ncbi:protein phosphatase CheZ [Herbaspirillum sp. RTI4]|uniref:protein phosphatase CheZ n=1 Tax=Herbaspirillum sp. RTI4 TaxID=3048640 RepID=UPI002AB4130C|nr:protein phosphatase CheZ [Herbaspirillum sp. RTI4]MDY7579555.1 protein phosphatase CheZ [Herbaspirillum sp. RTI4]MEA9981816.1 protein phosphatase CheZ [Herbaspirillum sp. RTI4]
MSDADVDLEALFDEISSQGAAESAATSNAPDAAAETTADPVPEVAEHTASAHDTSDAPPDTGETEAGADAGNMFGRLGGIVRLLHDSMRELGYDRSLTDAASQIGDAQSRLEYIATLTEQAANKVLNAIDEGMPAQDKLAAHAKDIDTRWSELFAGQMDMEQFKTLANDSRTFSSAVTLSTELEKARMMEIMMAQDFQDITGQLIKKIVNITVLVEQQLAMLLRDNAPPSVIAAIDADKPETLANGPSLAGSGLEQDDVDNLLDSLGF